MIDIISFIMRIVAVGIIALYIVPKQIIAVGSNPRDWLTPIRWQLLIGFTMVLITSIPTILLQYLRAAGIEIPEWLTETAKIGGNLAFLIFSIAWVLIYRHQDKR